MYSRFLQDLASQADSTKYFTHADDATGAQPKEKSGNSTEHGSGLEILNRGAHEVNSNVNSTEGQILKSSFESYTEAPNRA